MNQPGRPYIDESDLLTKDTIDLKGYWHIIYINIFGLLGFAFVTSSIAILIIFSLTPIYQGTATLLIEANEAKIVSIEEVYKLGAGRSEYNNTQYEILKSRELAEKIIQSNLELYTNYYQKKGEDVPEKWIAYVFKSRREPTLDNMIVDFLGSVVITPVRSTQLVKIGFLSSDPKLAALMANELARVYIENNLEGRLQMTKQATGWLTERIVGLKQNLVDSEQKLQSYKETEGLVDIEGVKTLIGNELAEAAKKLAQARQERTQAENIASQVSNLPDHSIATLSTVPAVLRHNLVQLFKQQEASAEQKLTELSKRYGDKHPKIIAAKSDLDVARQNTADQILKVVEGINKEYEVAKATEDALDEQMKMLKDKAQDINRKEYRLDELTREVTANQQLYDTFFNRIKETTESADMQSANARVVDFAVPPIAPVQPKRALLSAVAISVSLFVGLVLVYFKEMLDSTVKSRDDVTWKLHTQLLGVLPLLRNRQKVSDNLSIEFLNQGSSGFSESIRTIRTGVVLSALDNPHKILVITSSIPSEGKTTLSSNLAASFGQLGKTLLIDADMRRPSIAKNFGIPLSSPGLSNLVAQSAEPKACIHRVESASIDVIPAGMVPPNPLELLSSKRFAAVLAGLEKHYDRIIIDTAPCQVVSDAFILATYASSVIYVVKADSTNIKAVKAGISRMREMKAPITGIVLNQVDVEKNSKDGYGYGHYYGGYYDSYGYSYSSADKKDKS